MTQEPPTERTLIRAAGADALGFLNNLLTQQLDRLNGATLLYGALLSPQGKIIADLFLWAQPDGSIVVDADASRGPDVLRRLTLYKLRANVTLTDVSASLHVVTSPAPFDGAVLDPRLPTLGWRKLTTRAEPAPEGESAYRARLLHQGVPDLARDAAAEEIFALEGLLEELNGVDFQKGCFIGQENVSRMKRRATTRKKLCRVTYEGAAPRYGEPILAGEAEIGAMRSAAGGDAIALLRLDRAQAALTQGQALSCAGTALRFEPPSWLGLPGPAGAAD